MGNNTTWMRTSPTELRVRGANTFRQDCCLQTGRSERDCILDENRLQYVRARLRLWGKIMLTDCNLLLAREQAC